MLGLLLSHLTARDKYISHKQNTCRGKRTCELLGPPLSRRTANRRGKPSFQGTSSFLSSKLLHKAHSFRKNRFCGSRYSGQRAFLMRSALVGFLLHRCDRKISFQGQADFQVNCICVLKPLLQQGCYCEEARFLPITRLVQINGVQNTS